MKRYHVIVSGQVQGVGFRWYAMTTAREHGLSGTVRNMSNGMVDIYVQGEEKEINAFLDTLREGIGWIRVDDMRIKPVPAVNGEKDFICIG